MSKYIDAGRLCAEIKRQIRLEELNFAALGGGGQTFCINTLEWVLKRIDSLQQEQPDTDLEKEQQPNGFDEAYLNECIAKASKTWKGVDVDDYMDKVRGRDDAPTSPDFDTEVYNWLREHGSDETRQLIEMTARHFWEMAQNGGAMLHVADKSYKMGRRDERMVLMKDAIECEVIWIDGPILNYTQEQQDMVLEKINAHIGRQGESNHSQGG